jgi:hypothetical protein
MATFATSCFRGMNRAIGTVCTVHADLALARKFRLAVQDLPLLCTRLLQTEADAQPIKSLSLSEAQMQIHCAENDALKKIDAEKSALRSRRSALAARPGPTQQKRPSRTQKASPEPLNCSAAAEAQAFLPKPHLLVSAILGLPVQAS